MENKITNDFLAAMLMDPSSEQKRLSPNWLASAMLYRRPEYVTEAQGQWPSVQAGAGVSTGERAPLDQDGGPPVAKQSQNAPRSQPDIGMGRALEVGIRQGLMANFADEVAGVYRAGRLAGIDLPGPYAGLMQSTLGLARLGYETFRGERGPATEAYERARDQMRADTRRAEEQYPITYYTGNIGAGAAVPIGRAAQVATLPARMRQGAVAGGLFGGLSGVGSGETLTDRAIQGVVGAGAGTVIGAGVGAAAPAVVERVTRAGRVVANRFADGLDALSPATRGRQNAPYVRANRPQELWDPPTDLPQRPIELDYPRGVPVNAAGQITHTIEGQPIRAQRVFGRTTKDGPEYSLQPGDHDFLATALMGKKAVPKSVRDMRNALEEEGVKDAGDPLGLTWRDRNTGRPREIWLQKGMNPLDWPRVYAHELAHAIDDFAGQLPTKGLLDELKLVYNALNNPARTPNGFRAAPGPMFTPESRGYEGDEIFREYAVEAIRAYKTNANYIKRVAPRTAAAIREFFNTHPVISKIVQFNSAFGLPAASALPQIVDEGERGP